MKILRGKSNRDILPSNFIHNIDILKTMAKQPLFMSVYLLLRNNVLYHIDDRAVSELTAEKIAEILGYDLVVICGILLELEVAGWIKKHAAGYSLGTVQMTAVGGKIHYYYAEASAAISGTNLEDYMAVFKEKYRERYLYEFKEMYRSNGYREQDDRIIRHVISSLLKRQLPVLQYIDFIFDVVIPEWNRSSGHNRVLALKSLASNNLLAWYEKHLLRRSGVSTGPTKEPQKEMPKVRLVKGTLPDV